MVVTWDEVVTELHKEWIKEIMEDVTLGRAEIAEFSKIKEDYREDSKIPILCEELIEHCLEVMKRGMQEIEILRK